MYPGQFPDRNIYGQAATHVLQGGPAPGCDVATKAVPVPMFLARIDDNQAEIGDAVRRLADRLDSILCPSPPAAVGPGSGEAPRPTRCSLADRLADFSMRQATIIGVLNDIIGRLEI